MNCNITTASFNSCVSQSQTRAVEVNVPSNNEIEKVALAVLSTIDERNSQQVLSTADDDDSHAIPSTAVDEDPQLVLISTGDGSPQLAVLAVVNGKPALIFKVNGNPQMIYLATDEEDSQNSQPLLTLDEIDKKIKTLSASGNSEFYTVLETLRKIETDENRARVEVIRADAFTKILENKFMDGGRYKISTGLIPFDDQEPFLAFLRKVGYPNAKDESRMVSEVRDEHHINRIDLGAHQH